MLLEIKNLNVHYGKAHAIKDASLNLGEGKIVTLIGANGAGKTTVLRTVSGLKRPSSGEILFEGRQLVGLPLHEIVKMGIAHVPEGRRVFATMTVLENLEMGAYLRKDKKKIQEDLEKIYEHFPALKARRQQPAGSLSGGEQQMLATTRALMAMPRLLLMDEPSMGLSPLLVEQVEKIIKDINAEGISIVLVEQNARMALSIAGYCYILEVGRITREGPARDMADDQYVREAYLGG
ncbi:MAG: ABC transporter ATP-binding protein [Deltaproteobacteria bacterium]|nr:ABC transporter ATP-binding protein [Deltaproteobacteria bacterium]MBW2136382.1 ABC transporter ATP-binding protein [Deltaproteobacteria bacterium]